MFDPNMMQQYQQFVYTPALNYQAYPAISPHLAHSKSKFSSKLHSNEPAMGDFYHAYNRNPMGYKPAFGRLAQRQISHLFDGI